MTLLTKLKTANILDPIQDQLDERVFKDGDPRPTLVDYIQRRFFKELDKFVPDSEKYFDLYLTGSITTYQYGDDSDIDISVIPHYDELVKATGLSSPVDVRKALIKLVINKLDGAIAPGTPHTLQHFIVPPGTTLQDLFRPGLRSAWSFRNKSWVVPPEKNRAHDVQRELPGLFLRARNMADKMTVALDTDPETAKRLFQRIHKKRSEDQQRGLGDFCEGNIIYKYLLHEGLFDRIKNELGVYIAAEAPSDHDSVIHFLVDSLLGARGNVDQVRNFFVTYSQLGTPEQRNALVDEAYAIYQQQHAENRDNFNRLKQERELAQNNAGQYRWAYFNGKVAIQNVDREHGGDWDKRVHYEMLGELGVDESDLYANEYDDPNPENVPNLYLGYADVDYKNNRVDVMGDQSFDYGGYEEHGIPQEVQDVIAETIRADAGLQKTAARPESWDADWVCPECGATGGRDAIYEAPEGGFECRKCGFPITSKTAGMYIRRWIHDSTTGRTFVNNGEDPSHYPMFFRHGLITDSMDDEELDDALGGVLTGYIDWDGDVLNDMMEPVDDSLAEEIKKNSSEAFDTPLENPINYQYIPLGPGEMVPWQALSPDDKARWRSIAGRQNQRALKFGLDRGRVSGEQLHGLSYRYQGNCAYCGGPKADSWDHVVPLSKGGANTVQNLLPAHQKCNRELGMYDQRISPNPDTVNLSPAWLQVQASEDRVQVVYDFEKDRIILGIKNAAGLPSTVILGTYHQADGSVTLNETANQWVNAKYFKKLWRTSFPTYPLKVVHFHANGVHERIGAVININGVEVDPANIGYVEAFGYVGQPYNETLDSGTSEHYEIIYDFMQEHPEITDESQLENLPLVLGHIGMFEGIDQEHFIFYNQYVADFQSHSKAALNMDSKMLREKALDGLRALGYQNIIDVTGKVGRRWWTDN